MANSFTAYYGLPKPAHNDGGWDLTLNTALDDIDTLLHQTNTNNSNPLVLSGDVTGNTGASKVTSIQASSGTIDNVTIGASTRASGSFTSLFASSGTLDGITIGSTVPQSGKFTTITTTGSASFANTASAPQFVATNTLKGISVITTGGTPSSSSDTSLCTDAGAIWSDDTYLYRRTSTGSIMRIAWTTF